jgi:hypothetical protein
MLLARKYREVTYQEPVGRGFWGWIKLLVIIGVILIIAAAVI